MTTSDPSFDFVSYDYIARELNLRTSTVRMYARGPEKQRLSYFPKPVTPPEAVSPLFAKADADAFIARRRSGSPTGKGRVKPSNLTKQQKAAKAEARALLGRDIDLDRRADLRAAIYEDLALEAVDFTKNTGEPSVSTAALTALYELTGHSFVRNVLIYRGVDVDAAVAPQS